MTRIKRGSVARKYRKDIIESASGFRGAHSKLYRTANQQRDKALVSAYRDRNNRRREFRRLWITRINAAAHENGITYSSAIHYLSENRVFSNCKALAQIATLDSYCFSMLIQKINDKLL